MNTSDISVYKYINTLILYKVFYFCNNISYILKLKFKKTVLKKYVDKKTYKKFSYFRFLIV